MTIMLKTGLIISKEMVSLGKIKREDSGEKTDNDTNQELDKRIGQFTKITRGKN